MASAAYKWIFVATADEISIQLQFYVQLMWKRSLTSNKTVVLTDWRLGTNTANVSKVKIAAIQTPNNQYV